MSYLWYTYSEEIKVFYQQVRTSSLNCLLTHLVWRGQHILKSGVLERWIYKHIVTIYLTL
jgi:hypothetical protein